MNRADVIELMAEVVGEEKAEQILWVLNQSSLEIMPREATPEMIAYAWSKLSREKKVAGIARLGPGPGVTDVYRDMIVAGRLFHEDQ